MDKRNKMFYFNEGLEILKRVSQKCNILEKIPGEHLRFTKYYSRENKLVYRNQLHKQIEEIVKSGTTSSSNQT